jgi:hypothetical protein
MAAEKAQFRTLTSKIRFQNDNLITEMVDSSLCYHRTSVLQQELVEYSTWDSQVLTLFRVATLLHETALLGEVQTCCLFDPWRPFSRGLLPPSLIALHNTNTLLVPWGGGFDSWRDKDNMVYL